MSILLETSRLRLRRFTVDDAALLYDLDADPEVMRYIGPYGVSSVEAAREKIETRFLAHYASHPARGCFAAELKAGGDFIGWFFLRNATEYMHAREAGWTRTTDVELGYRLRRAAWGQGYATEASLALIRLVFDDPAVTGVVSAAIESNVGSWRVMEKCGLTRIGSTAIAGFDSPLVLYALFRPGCEPGA